MTTQATPSTAPPPIGAHWDKAAWGLLILVSGALFLDGVDLSMVNIALPAIGADLDLAPRSLGWIVNAYILGYGGFLLLGGRVSDLLGRRAVFLTAVGIFGVASIISAFSSDIGWLIALRLIKGISAGFTVPAGMAIVSTSFAPGHSRSRALTLYSVIGTMGFGLGLVLGGILTQFGWRLTFLVPGPIALLFFALGLKLIPRGPKATPRWSQFDLFGALTLTGGVLLLVYSLVEAPVNGWTTPITWTLLAMSAVLLAAFVLLERRHPAPLVRLGIFKNAAVVHANISAAILLGSFMGFQFIITLYLQDSLGWLPIVVALAFIPSNIIQPILGPRMGPIFARRGTTVPILVSLSTLTVAYFLMLRTEPGMTYWSFLLPTMLLIGLAFAIGFPAVNVGATTEVIDEEHGLASGLVNTSLQIGGALTLAVVTVVLSTASGSHEPGHLLPGFHPAMLTIGALTALGVLATIPRLFAARSRA